jgi:hypothetical protein
MRTKLIWCTVWVLGAVLIAASFDARPDPPALDPHSGMVKTSSPQDCADASRDPSGCLGIAVTPLRVQIHRTAFVHEDEPSRSSDFIARMGQAADPSPPARAGRAQS